MEGCGLEAFPCSGNGNGSTWYNRGSNGNYWSASLNSAANGRNLNFNSGGVNPQNTNNRFNGFTVRAVQLTLHPVILSSFAMILTRSRLLADLYVAYYGARKHKTRRSYVVKWERDLKKNMDTLCDDLLNRTYRPLPSKCFIVDYPTKREIFAAMFRDRIVHHLYYDYTHPLFERTFIQDSYSCVKHRGTHYGINRLYGFCRKESRNWQRDCHIMHLDVRGYFMHIDRAVLLDIALASLEKMASHRVDTRKGGDRRTWADILDLDFLKWLTGEIVLLDPTENCTMVGDKSTWDGLDPQKSMLHLEKGLGLPIGNLTSQLFSNVYLNALDQFMKRRMKCRYYGRYVDDAFVISHDKGLLQRIAPEVRAFLKDELKLTLHMGKLTIREVHQGAAFLGSYVKPYRIYTSRRSLQRMMKKIEAIDTARHAKTLHRVNSYLGILSHTASYRIRRRIMQQPRFMRHGVFDAGFTKITDRYKYNFNINN